MTGSSVTAVFRAVDKASPEIRTTADSRGPG
jgi:hypothetical protein